MERPGIASGLGPKAFRAGALALVLTAGAACTAAEDEDPREQAEALALALETGRFGEVRVTDDSPAKPRGWWRGIRGGMGQSVLEVEVTAVEEPVEGRATATLRHAWTVGAADATAWTYDTEVALSRRAGSWRVALDPGSVVAGLDHGESLVAESVAAERADILGAGGRPLVTERPVVRYGIDKTQVSPREQAASARAVARVVGVDADDFVARVEAAGDKAFVEAIVLRRADVTPEIRGLESVPGAGAIADELPLAPTREFARALLGTVGPVTAEMVAESDGEYAAGDVAGLSGLQARYDERLRGVPGTVVQAVDREGDSRTLYRSEPQAGEPLRTTLEPELQLAAERALDQVSPDVPSALVAVRPSTAELVAVASGAGSDGYATATIGQYAPGSTFKVVTSLALLRAGLTPEAQVACPRTTVVDGKEFGNYSDYPAAALGRITLREAVAHSCNTAFVGQHARISAEDLAEAAAALGLGVDHDLGFPAYFGQVPTEGSTTRHAADLIGQGGVLASPMVMAAVAASVSSGATVVPWLLTDSRPQADPSRPLAGEEAEALRDLMAAVVTQGSATVLAGLPGAPVIAKTGTAEFGNRVPPRTHAWMVGAQGDLAVAVFVEQGDSGSTTAGPVLARFLRSADGR